MTPLLVGLVFACYTARMLKDETVEHVAAQLAGKTWDELEVLEHSGYLLFPEEILRRTKSGKFEADKICLRVLRDPDKRKARLMARKWAEAEGVDPKLDPALFDDMDTNCVLSLAIRNRTPPHEPWEPDPAALERRYDRGSLAQLWAKHDAYSRLVDPRATDISEEQVIALAAAIARGRSIVPFHAFDGLSQSACIITMADLLVSSLASKFSSERSEPSTPAT